MAEPTGNQPVVSIPAEAFLKEHAALVGLVAENQQLRAECQMLREYAAKLEALIASQEEEKVPDGETASVPLQDEG